MAAWVNTTGETMKRVTSRIVTRYYTNGKGYNSASAAYKQLAKRELSAMIGAIADEILGDDPFFTEYGDEDYDSEGRSLLNYTPYTQAYAEKFPGTCTKHAFSWIKARAKEIQQEDQ